MTQGRHFFIESKGRLGDSHGRKPSRFVLNINCCLEVLNSINMSPRSFTWCVASLRAHVLHVKLLRGDRFCELSSHGSPDSFTPRILLSRCSGNPKNSQSPKSSHHLVPVRQLKLHDSRRLEFALRKSRGQSHTWGSQVPDVYLSSRKYNKLIAPQLSNRH